MLHEILLRQHVEVLHLDNAHLPEGVREVALPESVEEMLHGRIETSEGRHFGAGVLVVAAPAPKWRIPEGGV